MSLFINDDPTNFLFTRSAEEMTEEGLRKSIDAYALGGAKTVLLCGNALKAVYDSQVFDPMWKDVTSDKNGVLFYRGKKLERPYDILARNSRLLTENTKDPFGYRIRYGRSLGLRMFLSMRMNDVHNVHIPDNLLVPDFWREHPDYQVMHADAPYWFGLTFNYAIPAVYDYHLAMVREYLTRFAPDGLELDWMRMPYYFQPGTEAENAEILTRFLRSARRYADECAERSGHPVELLCRIPPRPEDARRMGFDVSTWAREKLINGVVLTSFWASTDFDMPIELWHTLLGEDVAVTAGLEILCRCTPDDVHACFNQKEMIFGFASSFYYRGSEGIYLFNHMEGPGSTPEHPGRTGMRNYGDYEAVLQTLGDRSRTEAQARRHVVTYLDRQAHAVGMPVDSILPLGMFPEGFAHIRINIGGSVCGRKAQCVFSCDNGEPTEFLVNSVPCKLEATGQTLFGRVENALVSELPEGVLKEGDNIVSFKGNPSLKITWCEIDLGMK